MKTAIIGAGNMGGSIARGLAKGTIIPANDIIVSNPTQHIGCSEGRVSRFTDYPR